MGIYHVTIVQEREQQFYVTADNRDDAEADGRELIDSLPDWVETREPDVMVHPVTDVPDGESVWSGGESGEWLVAG